VDSFKFIPNFEIFGNNWDFSLKILVEKYLIFFHICLVFLILVFMRKICSMNRSQRIWMNSGTSSGDKYIKFRLEQDVDTLEIMSIKLDTKEAYAEFNANYGVLVGRVTANGGVGISNAKVSVFIPLQEEDQYNSDIVSAYPYKTPRTKDNYGKRYNLLPRVGKVNPETNVIKPKQPFGSFPIKEEVVTNETQLEVYKKYYKYTTVTNQAGDYMIFGVPIGTQTIHMSCDITDIGKYSMTPAAMVTNLGYSPNLFSDNQTKIKPSTDLDDLPNIETQEITVDIIPFWGDTANFEIGITQQDFRIRATLVNTFTMFGSAFTDGSNSMWGENERDGFRRIFELYYQRSNQNSNVGISSKRIGRISEKIYYYPANITDEEIDANDMTDEMLLLDPSLYSSYKREGDFVFLINCNRDKVVTNEFGVEVPVPNDSTDGVFTKFRGFVTLEITNESIPMGFTGSIGDNTTLVPFRYKLKFPQSADMGKTFDKPGYNDNETTAWRRQDKIFEASKLYSFSRFHGLMTNSYDGADRTQWDRTQAEIDAGILNHDDFNDAYRRSPYYNVGMIVTGDFNDNDGNTYENTTYDFPSNTEASMGVNVPAFGSNWINFSIHLPQVAQINDGYNQVSYMRANTNFHIPLEDDNSYNRYFVTDNTQKIAGIYTNTKYFPRSDIHWTDIIEVPLNDAINMAELTEKGFTDDDVSLEGTEYRNGEIASLNPQNGGHLNGDPDNTSRDDTTYFYKGWGEANCIEYLAELGLL